MHKTRSAPLHGAFPVKPAPTQIGSAHRASPRLTEGLARRPIAKGPIRDLADASSRRPRLTGEGRLRPFKQNRQMQPLKIEAGKSRQRIRSRLPARGLGSKPGPQRDWTRRPWPNGERRPSMPPPLSDDPTAAPKPKCFQAATFDPDLRTPGRREGAPTSFEATATRELPQCKRGIGARGRVCPRNQTRPKALRLPRTRVPQMPQPSSTRWALPQAGPQRKELSGRPKQREHRQLPAQQNPEPSATAKPLPKRPARSDAPARREPRPSPEQPEQPVRPEPPVRLTPQTQPEHPVC